MTRKQQDAVPCAGTTKIDCTLEYPHKGFHYNHDHQVSWRSAGDPHHKRCDAPKDHDGACSKTVRRSFRST